MPRESITVEGHATCRGAYSPAVKVELPGATMLFVTGQLSRGPDGQVVGPNDVSMQTEYTFKLTDEILKQAGFEMKHIVRVQTYLTNINDFHLYRAVRDRWLGDVKPASTLIEVKGLALPECHVEIEVTAIKEHG
ncbi:MAG TPA: RidA family protein [Opitutaceae bacterium]|jgi:enamine deaminase RidA (YjgF/YER057c/UK114 family)